MSPGVTGAGGRAAPWGYLGELSVLGALGLPLIAQADTGARDGYAWAEPLFWGGLLLLFVPLAIRLLGAGAARRERLGLVVVLGLGLYLVKLLHSPRDFTFYDELQHWRTADDLLRTGHLFLPNSLLPVSPLYPGLEGATSAVAALVGLPIFAAGALVACAARLVLTLALFLLYEEVGGSARGAGIATLIYMANPNFVFFDAQFGYETLGLALAALTLYATARRLQRRAPAPEHRGLTLAILLSLAAVVVTHHVTTYALIVFLGAWVTVAALGDAEGRLRRSAACVLRWYAGWSTARAALRGLGRGRAPARVPGAPGSLALVALVSGLTWTTYVASPMLSYLGGFLGEGTREVVRLILREERGRQLFQGFAGDVAPLWERLVGYAAVGLIVLALPFGLRAAWGRRREAIVVALAGASLSYPATQALRFTNLGLQVAGRSAEFLFLALGFILALGMAEWWPARPRVCWRATAGVAWIVVVFVGGIILGWPRWARLPGPYLLVADTRSIEPQGVATAWWARDYLGPGNRIAADRINALLMNAYGGQRPVTSSYDRVDVPAALLTPTLGPSERATLRGGAIRYVIIDRRFGDGIPIGGLYFEIGEPGQNRHTTPLAAAVLDKFEDVPGVDRVYDSGAIVIYDGRGWDDAP